MTQAGRQDPLLAGFPDRIRVLLGHKEACDVLPADAVLLAAGDACPVQMFRVGQNVYATQFHPELTKEENLKRFNRYLDGYASLMSEEEIQETLERFDHSEEANELIARFLRLVFG